MTAGAAQVASVLPDLTRPQSGRGSFIAHTEASTGAELPLFIKAEPGLPAHPASRIEELLPHHWTAPIAASPS